MSYCQKHTQTKSSIRYGGREERPSSITKNAKSALFDNWSIKSIQTQLMLNPLYLKGPLNSTQIIERNKAINEFIQETEILMTKLTMIVDNSIKQSQRLQSTHSRKPIKHAEPITNSIGSQIAYGCSCWPGLLCNDR